MPLLDPLAHSRHLARLLAARPELASELDATATPLDAATLHGWLPASPLPEETLKPALRRFKQRVFARLAARDLTGRADLGEVVETMTLTAETAIAVALATLTAAFAARYGQPRNGKGELQSLIVVGMGKLGGRELNVSSDIDLVFVYPEDGETDGPRRIDNFEYFTRLGRALINALAEVTEDGQVFRVDMRLRPNGESGPLVSSFDMLENYFLTQGREWERLAWIKARPLTGCRWEELEALRQPFVFRKYLDFSTLDAIRDLHAQIRREVARKDMTDNIKLGPGGIREIEFIAQVFQLIRGGRDRALRTRATLDVFKLLVDRSQLELDAAVELSAAYRFLRRLEHRLQYLDDAQTHRLPENPYDQALLAASMGFTSYAALLAELDDHRQNVSRHFEAVFAERKARPALLAGSWQQGDGEIEMLARLGFADPGQLAARLTALRAGSRYRSISEEARRRFDLLLPRLIELAAHSPRPDAAAARMLDLLETVARRSAYLALLVEYPQALEQVAKIAGASAWAADYLIKHPILLDELLDPRLLHLAPDWNAFRREILEATEALEPDAEAQMDVLREAHHAQVFRLVCQDMAGLLTVERLSDHLSELADIIVARVLALAWRKLAKKHRETPAFAVIGYGKLGGKELGYASDLDLVYLYDDPAAEAAEIYTRLGLRINTWLSTRTAAGILFDVDLRLRPNGEAGLVATSFEAFRKYQYESAWLWEHQALTRARFVAGEAALGAAFEDLRKEILCLPREPAKLREEVLAMREKMRANLAGPGGEIFDLKHDPGGLVDVEFIVQYLILAHAWRYPQLTGNLGNIALLKIAAECSLIPPALAEAARNAYREYRRLQHGRRLDNLDNRVERAPLIPHIEAVRALWRCVFGE